MPKAFKDEITIYGLDEVDVDNTSIDELETESVTLVFMGIDASGSMTPYTSIMKDELGKFKQAIIESKSEDEVLIAMADFAHWINIRGYKKIHDLDLDYQASGNTRLFDTIMVGSKELIDYMNELKDQGMRVKCVFSMFSDGEDNDSKTYFSDAKQAVEALNRIETVTAYIAFGPDGLHVGKDLGFKNVLSVGNTESELRRAIDVLSKSVISQSKSVVAKTDDFFTI